MSGIVKKAAAGKCAARGGCKYTSVFALFGACEQRVVEKIVQDVMIVPPPVFVTIVALDAIVASFTQSIRQSIWSPVRPGEKAEYDFGIVGGIVRDAGGWG